VRLQEINGSKGDLVLTAPIGQVQLTDLTLEGGRGEDKMVSEMVIPSSSSYYELGKSLAIGGLGSTGRLYAQFAKDIREGTKLTPDFAHALAHHQLLDAIKHLHVQEWHRN